MTDAYDWLMPYANWSDEQIDRAIAELLGWRVESYQSKFGALCARLLSPDGRVVDDAFVIEPGQDVSVAWHSPHLPRFSIDLNMAWPLRRRLSLPMLSRLGPLPNDPKGAARVICEAALKVEASRYTNTPD